MGYLADLVKGEPIVIEKPDRVLDYLTIAQKNENSYNGQGGHLSWCNTVEVYVANGKTIYTEQHEAAAEALQQLLTDHGFFGVTHLNGIVTIDSWGGDKIGSSWDTIWQGLAQGYTNEDPTFWIMKGEDHEYWCQMIEEGGSQDLPVAVKYEVVA